MMLGNVNPIKALIFNRKSQASHGLRIPVGRRVDREGAGKPYPALFSFSFKIKMDVNNYNVITEACLRM